ncbi:RNA polymerase sporulation-specific sigma factor [Keratinibaculum paraultunense]|uniref:RNA polymerase sporulation-specific sigma factor n=1 Tax=Keratinibaculum paraultunense TaxID=1278232 RepID=A0A4R3KVX8_9FIRM|nr:sigma-70 family RNA polymerase sigma factor [Keratinibaculum paraultunense]QQY79155.1 sigma-70 family RNA polymerase sigma factor [Keratinibaculum paraultunense]TCS88539.1 RNA polymerase sporulation-specific sigma factor [Keratinibaculum paraultunense]
MYKEIERLLSLSKKNDKNAKEKLILKLEPLIISSIKRYYYNPYMYEDLLQEGYEIVLNAIEEYNPNKGCHFLGFVKLKLKYHYLNKHKEKQTSSLNQPVKDGDMELIDLIEDEGFSPLDNIIQKEKINKLKEGIKSLTPRQREVIIAYYIEGMSIKDIGKKLGIAYRTVVNIKTNAIDVLKNIIVK